MSKSYDTFEEMMGEIRKAEAVADGKVQPWQKELKKGDYFVHMYVVYGRALPIFGYILEERQDNYAFAKCFSVACVDGEMGDVHRSVFTAKITEELFNEAKLRGWELGGEKECSSYLY